MLKSYIDLEKFFQMIENDIKEAGLPLLSKDDVLIAKEVLPFLSLLADTTTHWQSSEAVIMSEVYPTLFKLLDRYQNHPTDPTTRLKNEMEKVRVWHDKVVGNRFIFYDIIWFSCVRYSLLLQYVSHSYNVGQ